MIKICRLGHRTPNRGVVTIASKIDIKENKIYYGVSYCSPKEKKYLKQLGTELALDALEEHESNNQYIPFYDDFKYGNILSAVIHEVWCLEEYPKWAEALIAEQCAYPIGLKRYPNKKDPEDYCEIKEIVVESEFAKEQLLLAFEYIHNLREIDSDFIAVCGIMHLYQNPEIFVVKS